MADLSEKIRDYIDSRKRDRLDKFDKDTQKGVQAAAAENVAAYEMERAALRVSEEDRFKPVNWLSDAANRAKQLQLVTHAMPKAQVCSHRESPYLSCHSFLHQR